MRSALLVTALALVAAPMAVSQDLAGPDGGIKAEDLEPEKVYSPYAGRAYADQVFFGDMHFHTNLSFDAGLVGTSLDVHDGFRVARGEKVISNTGQPIQLIRPLDFLVVTDHAEFMGLAPALRESKPELLADPWGAWAHERFNSGQEGRMEVFGNIIEQATVKGVNPFESDDLVVSIWNDFVQIADQYDEPGRFTAMTGFEWTSSPMGNNLHRVVVFADGADKTTRTTPYSMFDSDDPEGLWKHLARYEERLGELQGEKFTLTEEIVRRSVNRMLDAMLTG